MSRLDSFCGLYCGACLCNILKDEGTLEEVAKAMHKPVEHLTCTDCKTALHQDCSFVLCCTARGIESCAACPDLPCAEIIKFAGDGIRHHALILNNLKRIREIGSDNWLMEQKQQYTCPNCNARLRWLETVCEKCGSTIVPD
jgi:hypothetical protein